MRVLLTNDDGIEAKGIQILRKILVRHFDITVVAPDREKSATGHGITMHKPLRVQKKYIGDTVDYAVDGTPVDCVKLAVEEILPEPPDLLVSGINLGPNLGTDVWYSGTVSAAIEGTISDIPSIAVSLDLNEYENYESAANFIVRLAHVLANKGLPAGTILNVNVPDMQTKSIKGVQVTRLGVRKYINSIEKRRDPRGKTYYWIGGEVRDIEEKCQNNTITDICAVSQGYISVCPINIDLTHHGFIEELKKWPIR